MGCGQAWFLRGVLRVSALMASIGVVVAGPVTAQAQVPVAAGAEVKKIVGDCKFTEGPAYSPKGFLLFSDIPNTRIVRVGGDGAISDFMKPSGKANGLVFDQAGHLYICQGEARRVVRMSGIDGRVEVLADQYDGKPLNSPNDLALDGQGGLYFTDPRYGSNEGVEQPCMGVYYIAADGHVTRVIDSLERPNGILVSNDGQALYVAEPNKRQLWMYPLTSAGKVGEGKPLFTGNPEQDGGGPDGMALDTEGRIYATYKSVVVLSPKGDVIGRIATPEQPANCTFGGPDMKTLYITARTSLYAVETTATGAARPATGPRPSAPRLGQRAVTIPVRTVSLLQEATTDVKVGDLALKLPKSWAQQEPANRLRLAQFAIPAAEGDKEPAELVVSFFGGDGGGIDPNLKRWNDQFTGDTKKIKLSQGECAQGAYYFSDVSGTYLKTVGPPIAGKKEPVPGYRSVGIILIVKDKGNYFLRLTGPDKTVQQATDGFRTAFGGDAAKEKPYEIK